jgi:AcrR family transcriptional regulator
MPTLPNPQTARYQEKREAILSAAALLFNEQGVKGATLSGIAASVGLVTNSVTYYYRKKEELATACFLRSIAAFDAIAVAAAASGARASQRLQAFFRLHAQLLADIEEARHAPLIAFNDIRALPEQQAGEVFAAYTAMFRHVRALLKGDETAGLTRDDLNARAHMVLSIANWMWAWLGRYESAEYHRVADRISDIMVNGIGGPGSRWLPAAAETEWHPVVSIDGTSEAFLRAATVLVNEQGYRGASVDKISARLNVTKGSFYHHNDNKLDLIAECFERTFSVMRQALSLAETGTGSGWSRACTAARVLVRFQLSDEGPLLRASATTALPDQAQRGRAGATLGRLAERMTSVVVDGMVDGSIRPLDPSIAAQTAVAAVNAAAELRRWVAGVDAATVSDLYIRAAFEGVFCPGPAEH